jgi:peptide/nickel transport system permease protein
MINFFQGDFGFSFSEYPRPVSDIILERLPRTLVLFMTAVLTYYWAGFVAGKFIAWRRGKRGEHAITIGGVTLYTAFYPWFALMMIWFFAFRLDILPINKFLDPNEWRDAPYASNTVFLTLFFTVFLASVGLLAVQLGSRRLAERRAQTRARWLGYGLIVAVFVVFWWVTDFGSVMRPYAADIAEHMVLPVLTLTLINFAGIMLLTRSSMLETMREDFIMTARAKGLPESQIRDRHAARTALLPVTTSLVLAVAAVIDGGIITETVFSWPGMGQVLLSSVVQEDTPLAMAAFSFVGVLAMLGHLAVDIMYGFLDPRIRVS